MGVWSEKVKIKLNSTQVLVEVEVIVELGYYETYYRSARVQFYNKFRNFLNAFVLY